MDWYDRALDSLDALSLELDEIIRIVIGVAEGLDYAFRSRGLIHRDVKPSNVLIDASSQPRIADFGLAVISESRQALHPDDFFRQPGKTSRCFGSFAGTPFYLAPELLAGNVQCSLLTDIYSFGVAIFEWLTGEHPYFGPETNFCLEPKLRDHVLRRVERHLGSGSSTLLKVITACVSLVPSKRPRSYRESLEMIGSNRAGYSQPPPFSPSEVVKLATMHRANKDFCNAAKLLDEALVRCPGDAILLNAYARLRLHEGRPEDAIALFKKASESLATSKGIYDGKPYLDPVMNLAKFYVVAQEYDAAQQLLSQCQSWNQSGAFTSSLQYYEEWGWYLLAQGNCEESTDLLFEQHNAKVLDNTALRWLTSAAHFSGALRFIAPRISASWLRLGEQIDGSDIFAMCLCALWTPPPARQQIWKSVEKKYSDRLLSVGAKAGFQKDWYKREEGNYPQLLAAMLDLVTTGGAYADRYASLMVRRSPRQ